MYNKTKKHLEDTMKFVLIYSYCTDKEDGQIALNQNAIGRYLGLTKMTMIRHFSKMRELGLISIKDKTKYTTNSNSKWYSNLYSVNQDALNEYIKNKTNYDVLDNFEEESKVYYEFMTLIKTLYNEKRLSEMSEEEKELEIKKIEKREKRDKEKLDNLKNENKYYLDLLNEVNNDIIPMNYLNENRKRLTNALCVTKNPEIPGHENDMVRKKMLSNFFNTDKNIVEFDTNASIYRLSYALGNNKLANHTDDIYRLVFNECNFNVYWAKTFRTNFKELLMPIYMKEGSIEYTCFEYKKQRRWKYFISKEMEKRYNFYKYFEDTLQMDLKDILTTVQKAMHKVFNMDKFYQSNIFIHESNLHILMLKRFKELNIQTIDVYDGFYFIEGTMTQELYNEIYDDALNSLLENMR